MKFVPFCRTDTINGKLEKDENIWIYILYFQYYSKPVNPQENASEETPLQLKKINIKTLKLGTKQMLKSKELSTL